MAARVTQSSPPGGLPMAWRPVSMAKLGILEERIASLVIAARRALSQS